MIVVCCYCGAKLGEKEPRADRRVSHGACPTCVARVLAEWHGKRQPQEARHG